MAKQADDAGGDRIRLADVVEMVRANPPVQRHVPEPWTLDVVERLPRAAHQMLAPIPAAPGACEQIVPEGGPMPPGTVMLHELTVELRDAYQRQERFERRDHGIACEQQRLAEIDRMVAELGEHRARALARIEELEAIEPVEPLDWPNLARRIRALSGYRHIPEGLTERQLALTKSVLDRREIWHGYRSNVVRDRLGRWRSAGTPVE